MHANNQTQQVIDLLENNLFNMNYEQVARLTGIPIGLYHRIFSYICGISMSEYIRKRKLSECAQLLLNGEKNVTELALDCGYESTASFTRAFKEQFLVAPTKITLEIFEQLAFRSISFFETDSYYVLKGKKIMADIVKIEYVTQEERLLIGISSKQYGVSGRRLWDLYFQNHFDDKLEALKEHQVGMEDCIGLGYATEFISEEKLGETYIVGKFFEVGTQIPEGMIGVMIKGSTIAKAQVGGANFDDILNHAYLLISDIVVKNGYVVDYEDFYWIEFYTVSRFCEPLEKGEKRIVCDWIMPCKKLED